MSDWFVVACAALRVRCVFPRRVLGSAGDSAREYLVVRIVADVGRHRGNVVVFAGVFLEFVARG